MKPTILIATVIALVSATPAAAIGTSLTAIGRPSFARIEVVARPAVCLPMEVARDVFEKCLYLEAPSSPNTQARNSISSRN